jgi:hypothetical protein
LVLYKGGYPETDVLSPSEAGSYMMLPIFVKDECRKKNGTLSTVKDGGRKKNGTLSTVKDGGRRKIV